MEIAKDWKCGNCGKEYNTEEMLTLKRVKAIEEDKHPEKEHGFVSVCDCGYRFHKDTWRLCDNVKVITEKGEVEIYVSSVYFDFIFSHFGEEPRYETRTFPNVDWFRFDYEQRRETKEDAEKDHNRVLDLL